MIRVVLDTNVILSAALSIHGRGANILHLAQDRRIRLYFSPAVWREYVEVLGRPQFDLDVNFVRRFLEQLQRTGHLVRPNMRIVASPDPKDNIFLECAEAAKAHYLVTENVRDFPKVWKYTRVVRPGRFLKVWESQKPLGLS